MNKNALCDLWKDTSQKYSVEKQIMNTMCSMLPFLFLKNA